MVCESVWAMKQGGGRHLQADSQSLPDADLPRFFVEEEMQDDKNLKPCPFCGGEKLRITESMSNDEDDSMKTVACDTCWSYGPIGVGDRGAAVMWNARHE